MTALAVAQRLGLSEAAVAAFSGTGAEFAQFFGTSIAEGEAASADLATPPGAPTNPSAAVVNVTTADVAFIPPVDTGGSPITGYVITSTPAITLTYDANDATSPVRVTGTFATGIAYTFKVAAKNAAGTGPQSTASAAITPNP